MGLKAGPSSVYIGSSSLGAEELMKIQSEDKGVKPFKLSSKRTIYYQYVSMGLKYKQYIIHRKVTSGFEQLNTQVTQSKSTKSTVNLLIDLPYLN